MGTSSDGMLYYGYDLAGGEAEWKIQEKGSWGEPNLPWYDEDDEFADFTEKAEERLRAEIAGFNDAQERSSDDFYTRQKAADKQVGVTFETYCHGEHPMYVLAAHEITVYRGSTKLIDWVELERQRIREDWDGKLQRALTALGITPEQEAPGWILASYTG